MSLPTGEGLEEPRQGPGRPGRSGPPGNRNAEKSGIYRLKSAVKELGSRAIDRRTMVGRALAAWRRELIDDLGGPDQVSTQQAALVDLLTREKLLIDSVDAYLAELGGGIINRKKRALLPIVRERAQLADSFTRRLLALGLERRAQEPLNLSDYLAQRSEAQDRQSDTPTEPLEGTGTPDISDADEGNDEGEVTP